MNRDIVVIGASAGGVEALKKLTSMLPARLPAAVFAVVHFPAFSTSVLPDILGRSSPLDVVQATDGEAIRRGRVYVAPPDFHLLVGDLVGDGVVRLSRGPRENHARPAIDPLFRSAAEVYGRRAIGVILSGTLYDGTAGAIALKRRGGAIVVQDPNDALFAGMPQSVIDHTPVDHILPLLDIAPALVRLTGEPMGNGTGPTTFDEGEGEIVVAEEQQGDNLVHRDQGAQVRGERDRMPAVYTCPECAGALWQVNEETLVRFRCHVGHVFTGEELLREQGEVLESAMWYAVRTMRDKANLARQLAGQARARGHQNSAARFEEQARTAEQHAEVVRRLIETGGVIVPEGVGAVD